MLHHFTSLIAPFYFKKWFRSSVSRIPEAATLPCGKNNDLYIQHNSSSPFPTLVAHWVALSKISRCAIRATATLAQKIARVALLELFMKFGNSYSIYGAPRNTTSHPKKDCSIFP